MMPPALKARIAAAVAGGARAIAVPLTGYFEGLRPTAYLDPVGIPTICYGSTAGVRIGQRKSQVECDRLLAGELGQALAVVDRSARVPMPDTRRAALASFVYNVGPGAYQRSTLLRRLNGGDTVGGCNELLRWNRAGGQVLPGLTARREAERELCLMH